MKIGLLLALAGLVGFARAEEVSCDLVVYGSSPAALTAAIEAQAMGRTAVIVSPETRIGGLTTGGLGQTDIGNKSAFGGLALSFYQDIAAHYRDPAAWKWQKRNEYLPDGQCAGSQGEDSMWTFEPSAALKVLESWEKKYALDIRRGERLDRGKGGVTLDKGRIVSFRTLTGNVYRGRMFVDATYEGDLMAAAGVSYFVGREDNSVYGETISGYAPKARGADHHNFLPGVDPYVVKGDKSSGLLKGVEPYDPAAKVGDGDRRVQAYCFRMCLTDLPENRIPFIKPEGYDERDYELLFRNYEQGAANESLPWINSKMPNRKTDTNNRNGFSTDFIGGNWAWPEASYEERERILKAHLDYQMGLMWTLANHPRIPEKVRKEVSLWGTCKDEFPDGLGNGWQRQLYVREARRLVGEYVMTEHHCRGARTVDRPIAMGAYGMDSHHCRRMVTKEGFVRNEGNVEDYIGVYERRLPPYGIDYGAITPKRGECVNLLVPVCLSASHMAFGSIRMEPVFFALGQAAGAAASIALLTGVGVQEVDYRLLRQRLLADGQVISRDPPRRLALAAANSSRTDRLAADLVCTGVHDEAVINRAIGMLTKGGTVQLLDGDYNIDGFPCEGNSAICVGYNDGKARVVNIVGTTENKSYNTHFGVVLHVTAKAMAAIGTNGTWRVFYGTPRKPKAAPDWFTYTHVNNVNFENFYLYFTHVQKPLIGIDCRNFGSSELRQVGVYSEQYFRDRFLHLKPAVPAKGTLGIYTTPGSNDEMARVGMTFVNVGGLHTGYYFNRIDHLVMQACSACRCCYGYVFNGGPKTLTMINCCDEGNTHLPRFMGTGHLSAIDFNIERFNAAYIPDDPDGNAEAYAIEDRPGAWRGMLSYTLQGDAFKLKGFWKDGHGAGFATTRLDAPAK